MRERVTKCKVAILQFPCNTGKLAIQADFRRATRSRKDTAESGIRHESKLCHSFFSAQTKRAKGKMTGKNSPQKSFSGPMNVHFAPGDTLAHFRPRCAIFVPIPEKPYICCVASFRGRTGTPKSPAHFDVGS